MENPRKLNKDVEKLRSEIYRMSFGDTKEYFEYIENTAKKEFIRLYNLDSKFQCFNRDSILILIRLNLRHRFIPLHQFGLSIDI